MARGLPDYYNPSSLVSQRMVDLAGVLSAVAKIPPVDGRGRIFFVDAFGEGYYGWIIGGRGTGHVIKLDTAICEVPPCSLYVSPGIAGIAPVVSLSRYNNISNVLSAGFEVGISSAAQMGKVEMCLSYDDGDALYTGQVTLTANTGALQIVHAGGTTTIDTLRPLIDPQEWVPVKLAVSFEGAAFIRLIIGNNEYDLSAYALVSAASSLRGRLAIFLQLYSTGVFQTIFRVGHGVITLDEP